MGILLASSKYMPEYSGSGLRAHNLYKRLTAAAPALTPTVLTSSVTHDDNADYEFDGVTVHRAGMKPCPELSEGPWRALQLHRNFMAERKRAGGVWRGMPGGRPDLVHAFGKSHAVAAALDFAAKNAVPAIIELCNEMETPFQYVPKLTGLRGVSDRPPPTGIFVCISERLRRVALANGIAEENIWCRPNPVDESVFRPVTDRMEKSRLRAKRGAFSGGERLICYIAKFRPSKNHRFLLDVMRRLPDEYKLFMAGPLAESGPLAARDKQLFDDIAAETAAAGLQDRVKIESGFRDDIAECYQMADVYAFPSMSEGLGTPVLESVACGVPVVANLLPGVTDVSIRNGVNGFLCRLNAAEFAEKIIIACQWDEKQLRQASDEILACCGSGVIDAEYLRIIKRLAPELFKS